jgi:hypothetical protein
LEWLVRVRLVSCPVDSRRAEENEFNADDVFSLFLPYHDLPHFLSRSAVRLGTLSDVRAQARPNAPWNLLNAYKLARGQFTIFPWKDSLAGVLPRGLGGLT